MFNIASGKQISINELANLIMKIMRKKLKPIYEKARPGDIRHSVADISKAKGKLGFKPKYSLGKGLKAFIRGKVRSK